MDMVGYPHAMDGIWFFVDLCVFILKQAIQGYWIRHFAKCFILVVSKVSQNRMICFYLTVSKWRLFLMAEFS